MPAYLLIDACLILSSFSFFVDYHKVFFCTFIITSELYMMLSYYLNKSARRNPNLDEREMKSLRLKRNLCIINILSILLATYFFIRHNDHCEGGSKYSRHKELFFQTISQKKKNFLY